MINHEFHSSQYLYSPIQVWEIFKIFLFLKKCVGNLKTNIVSYALTWTQI